MSSPSSDPATTRPVPASWSPWRAVVAFGLVSLAADMVYEGMRSVSGPLLASLGASALVVGLVTGAGEAVALTLRLVTGPWADSSHQHWRLTVVGYAMTAVCVPLLAVTPALGAAGVATASVLILLERAGKAVRSPAKSALLARMTVDTGRGRGFGVHKALDQVGAFAGPLMLAGVTAMTGALWPGLALLAIPGALSLILLGQLRRRVPSVAQPDPEAEAEAGAPTPERSPGWWAAAVGVGLPREFHLFSLACALSTAGLMTFGVISYAAVRAEVVSSAAVPLLYALAMAVGAVAALVAGHAFDRWGVAVLFAVPLLVAAIPATVFAEQLGPLVLGLVVWGAATGVQDSTVKAYVADLVPSPRRATGYGVFAAIQGLGALAGGALAGALVLNHTAALVAIIGALQVLAMVLLVSAVRMSGRAPE